LRRARRLQPLIDADWLVLDPIDDAGSPLVSTMRQHGLPMPTRIEQSASNLLGLQLATQTDLISMGSDFVLHGTGPLQLDASKLERLAIADKLPDIEVFMVYRSVDLMTHVCTEFVKEARHFATSEPPWREARRKRG
jgi:hypothetical protein